MLSGLKHIILFAIAAIVVFPYSGKCQALVYTVAGGGTSSANGIPATAAGVYNPYGICQDATGNIYFSDGGGYKIRKIIAATGNIYTIGGGGTGGDGIPATSSRINYPYGLWADPAGNCYFADAADNRVRRIDASTGIITTVAGGGSSSADGIPATNAQFTDTRGLCGVSGSGDLYIGEGSMIRKVDGTTGIITTICGNGFPSYAGDGGPATAAQVGNFIGGMAFDGSGNLYLSDLSANNVRMISAATGIITTVAGTPPLTGFSGDGGPATDAKLSGPLGLSVDCFGNVLISDRGNFRIRKVDGATGIITTLAGGGSATAEGSPATSITMFPQFLYLDPYGTCFYTDFYSRIHKITNFTTATVTGGNITICQGASTTLFVPTGGGLWTSSNTSVASVAGTGLVSGTGGGSATVTYTMASGCVAMTTITVTPLPSAGTITGLSDVCIGSSIALTDASPWGTWLSSTTTIATVSSGTVAGVATGVDTITYTVTNSCGVASATKTITVSVPPSAGVITGSSALCAGAAITLTDAATSGSWSSSNTTVATVLSGVINGLTAGTTTIAYTVTNACATDQATKIITVNPVPNAGSITGASTLCVGANITLSDAAPGGLWSSSNTTIATISAGLITALATGTTTISYSVTSSGCTALATRTMTVIATPSAGTVTGASGVCQGSSVILSDIATGGAWSSSNTTMATVTSGTVTGITPGTAVISYTVSNSCGSISATHPMTIDPAPDAGTATMYWVNALCVGYTATISDDVAGGTWVLSNANATVAGNIVTAVSSGPDTLWYIVSNSCGSDTATVHFAVAGPMPPITGKLSVCIGDTTMLWCGMIGGMWSGGSAAGYVGSTMWTDSGYVVGLSAGTAIVTCHFDLGCSAFTTVTVLAIPDHGIITGLSSACIGAAFSLSESIANGIWSSGNPSVASINNVGLITGLSLGSTVITYTVPTAANGCSNETSFPITIIPSPIMITSTVSQVTCFAAHDGSVVTDVGGATGPLHYTWSNGNSSTAISNLDPGSYLLAVKDSSTQCITTATFTITQPDTIAVAADVTNDLCKAGGSIRITASGGTQPYQYVWSNNAVTSEITGLSAAVYSVTIRDANNCTKSTSAIVSDTCNEVIIPDVITPNGDGINDTWVIKAINNYPGNTVQVFDKWGTMLYEKTNYNNDWSGQKNNGEPLPSGTYFYLVKLNAINVTGGQNAMTGSVLIKR